MPPFVLTTATVATSAVVVRPTLARTRGGYAAAEGEANLASPAAAPPDARPATTPTTPALLPPLQTPSTAARSATLPTETFRFGGDDPEPGVEETGGKSNEGMLTSWDSLGIAVTVLLGSFCVFAIVAVAVHCRKERLVKGQHLETIEHRKGSGPATLSNFTVAPHVEAALHRGRGSAWTSTTKPPLSQAAGWLQRGGGGVAVYTAGGRHEHGSHGTPEPLAGADYRRILTKKLPAAVGADYRIPPQMQQHTQTRDYQTTASIEEARTEILLYATIASPIYQSRSGGGVGGGDGEADRRGRRVYSLLRDASVSLPKHGDGVANPRDPEYDDGDGTRFYRQTEL